MCTTCRISAEGPAALIESMLLILLSVLATQALGVLASPSLEDNLTVDTVTGTFAGLIESASFPDVRQFRNIPYAQPPLGKLRWMPPVALAPSARRHYSHRFPPSCPQYLSKNATLWNSEIIDFAIDVYGQNLTGGATAQTTSEDCLSLAVWAPRNVSADAKLPVAIFIPGGSFLRGGVAVRYQEPAHWVQRTRSHIMVAANYRLNVFGFPWAGGMDDQNVGIMDIRMALEWVYANIAAFGGDPSRITLWGQSAGAVGVDLVNYGWYDDPLVSGFFMHSGTAMVGLADPDPAHANFTFVSRSLGCDFPHDLAAELECMRQVPMALIQNFIGQYADNGTDPSLIFKPRADERRLFSNYTARAEKGFISKVPAIVSTTANEESSLYKYPATNVTLGPYQPLVDKNTLSVFVCPAYNTSNVRAMANLTTYRYQYAGNFSNVTPRWWMGAYHASDIPMLFGTYVLPGPGTDLQVKLAEVMQDYLLGFMEDPENGPRTRGWLPDNKTAEEGGRVLRFGSRGILQQNVTAAEIDGACVSNIKYDSSP